MNIEIFGTGCHNCVRLELLVAEVIEELGITDATLARVSDECRIRRYMTLDAIPGLVINGRLVSERQVPARATLTAWLSGARAMDRVALGWPPRSSVNAGANGGGLLPGDVLVDLRDAYGEAREAVRRDGFPFPERPDDLPRVIIEDAFLERATLDVRRTARPWTPRGWG